MDEESKQLLKTIAENTETNYMLRDVESHLSNIDDALQRQNDILEHINDGLTQIIEGDSGTRDD